MVLFVSLAKCELAKRRFIPLLKKHRDMISREKDTVRANYDDVVESTGFVVSSPLARFHLRLMNPVISKKKTLCIAWGSCGRPP